ncbi:MAG TPA: nucleotide-binding protein [Candidatus Acidoferrales bacterium]|nr:nucleotide-binding protein [Candidatus Acidoferrales bacterium]
MPLNGIETRICGIVVRRFLEHHEATPRNALLLTFKTSLFEPLQKLTSRSLLTNLNQIAGDETYLPRAIAFHYCGDAAALSLARQSTELVLQVARNLFDRQLETEHKEPFTSEDALSEAKQIDSTVQPEMVWLGLYLAQEFSIFCMLQKDQKQIGITFFRPSEQIYRVTGTDGAWERHIQDGIKTAEHEWTASGNWEAPDSLETIDGIDEAESNLSPELPKRQSRKVFLVHGRDKEVLHVVSKFLASLDLDVVILYKQPNRGQTIIEKFEKHSDVGFAVVLLTPDDVGASVDEPEKRTNRPRQNVILELGYFIARLGRERVCPLQIGQVELPSDIHGIVYVPYDNEGEWRRRLADEISAAGIKVDTSRIIAEYKSIK